DPLRLFRRRLRRSRRHRRAQTPRHHQPPPLTSDNRNPQVAINMRVRRAGAPRRDCLRHGWRGQAPWMGLRRVPPGRTRLVDPLRYRNLEKGGQATPNTCRKYARYPGSSHIVFPGESLSFATGCPLQRTIFITTLSGGTPTSFVRFVPIPNDIRARPRNRAYSRITRSMSRLSLNTSTFVRGSIRWLSRCAII